MLMKKRPGQIMNRRSLLKGTAGVVGLAVPTGAVTRTLASAMTPPKAEPQTTIESGRQPAAKEIIKITGLETFLVKPRWLFLKVHTNAGITGLGEPITEGRAQTCMAAVKEIEPYLVGKDPRAVTHHWQAIY